MVTLHSYRNFPHVDRYLPNTGYQIGRCRWYLLEEWILPGLDIVSIYALIAHLNPEKIIEIGSGNSTAVMRKGNSGP